MTSHSAMFPSTQPYSLSPPSSLRVFDEGISFSNCSDCSSYGSSGYYASSESSIDSSDSAYSSASSVSESESSPKPHVLTVINSPHWKGLNRDRRPSTRYSLANLYALRPQRGNNSSPGIPILLGIPQLLPKLPCAGPVVDNWNDTMSMSSSSIYPSSGSENDIENWKECKGPPIYLASSPAQYTSSKETSTTLSLGPVDSRVPICPPTDPSPTGSMESSINSVPSYLSTPGGGPSEVPIENPRKHKSGESSKDSSKPRKDMYTCLCGDWGMGKHSCSFYVGRRQLTRQRITDVLEKIPRVDSAPRRNSAKENKEAVTKRWKGIWKNVLEDIIEYEGKQAEMMNDEELVEAMKEAFTRRTGDYQANYQATILAGSYFPVMEDVWDSDEEEMKEDDYAHEALWDAGVDWVDTVMSR